MFYIHDIGMKKGDSEDVQSAPSIFLSQKFAQKQLDKDPSLTESLLSTKELKTEISSNQDVVNFSEVSHELTPSKKAKYSPR